MKYIIQYVNEFNSTEPYYRFTDKYFDKIINYKEIKSEDLLEVIVEKIIKKHSTMPLHSKLLNMELLKLSEPEYFKEFDLSIPEIAEYILDKIIKKYNDYVNENNVYKSKLEEHIKKEKELEEKYKKLSIQQNSKTFAIDLFDNFDSDSESDSKEYEKIKEEKQKLEEISKERDKLTIEKQNILDIIHHSENTFNRYKLIARDLIQNYISLSNNENNYYMKLMQKPFEEFIFISTPELVFKLIQQNILHKKELKEKAGKVYIKYLFEKKLTEKKINKENFTEKYKKYFEILKDYKYSIADLWIKTYKEEPPLEIYFSPNEYNLSNVWSRYINSYTIPKEMKSMNYWRYMIKTNGEKKNPNNTTMYTYFYNSNENKIIFCQSDVEFNDIAVLRFEIPILYSEVKDFLTQKLQKKNICKFTHLTKNDWNVLTNGNLKDIVVFSEYKNILEEDYTEMPELLNYFETSISTEFGVEVIKPDSKE